MSLMWLKIKTCCDLLVKGGTLEMVAVYVALIIAGRRTYKQVPSPLKAKVADELRALDLEDLITE